MTEKYTDTPNLLGRQYVDHPFFPAIPLDLTMMIIPDLAESTTSSSLLRCKAIHPLETPHHTR